MVSFGKRIFADTIKDFEMGSSWIVRVDPKSHSKLDTQRRRRRTQSRPCEDPARGDKYASTSQRGPVVTRSWKTWGKPPCSFQNLQRTRAHLHLDFRLLPARTVREYASMWSCVVAFVEVNNIVFVVLTILRVISSGLIMFTMLCAQHPYLYPHLFVILT